MNRLTEEKRAVLAAALEGAGATLPCPRCGCSNTNVADGYIVEHTQGQLRNIVISGDNSLACMATICGTCGYVAEHVLKVLGVTTP